MSRRVPAGVVRDPVRVCEILVGLADVAVLGVLDEAGQVLEVHVERHQSRVWFAGCGSRAHLKDQRPVRLVDLPCLGRPTVLVWHKRRWRCPDGDCERRSWSEEDSRIASARLVMTDRAGRWATVQVGMLGRTVSEVARELDCDWHTVNDTVIAYGTALVDDPGRVGPVAGLGLDETLFCRRGRWGRQEFATSIVDVTPGRPAQLLDVVHGRSAAGPSAWITAQPRTWRDGIRFATLDLSGPYRKTFDDVLPDATLVVDPFHVCKVRHEAPCLRRRVRDPPLRAVTAAW